jgi:mono/diheme cytochrome c family protein
MTCEVPSCHESSSHMNQSLSLARPPSLPPSLTDGPPKDEETVVSHGKDGGNEEGLVPQLRDEDHRQGVQKCGPEPPGKALGGE